MQACLSGEQQRAVRITFVINSIASGGAERVLQQLLQPRWYEPVGMEPNLLTLDDLPDARAMPADVSRTRLDARGGLIRSAHQLRRTLTRRAPTVCVSFLVRANCANIVAAAGRSWRTIICERMHLSSHLANQAAGSRLAAMRLLPRLLYPHANAIMAVSQGVAEDLAARFGVPAGRLCTIPNPYDLAALGALAGEPAGFALPADYCVTVGRLVPAKNTAMVLSAFAASRPTRNLVIVGDGPERGALIAQAQSLGLAEHVHFPGYLANPYPVVAGARIYLSASRNEGFPNAMAEAMALGVAVVATDCTSGPAELLDRGRAGRLVAIEDEAGMAAALRALTPAERNRLGLAARVRVAQFAIERIAPLYWECFAAVARGDTIARSR